MRTVTVAAPAAQVTVHPGTWAHLIGSYDATRDRLRDLGHRLTTIPNEEWREVEAEAQVFWEEIAGESERAARVVQILKDYTAVMEKAGPPYRG